MEIKTYTLTDEQVVWLLNHPDEEIEQLQKNDLYNKNVNAVIRMKNRGGKEVWGLFTWETCSRRSRVVGIDNITSYKEKFVNFIFPLGQALYFPDGNFPEEIRVTWITLCTKNRDEFKNYK